MDISTRPVEWIAISAVVAGGLWAGLYLAPAGESASSAVSSPFASSAQPAAAPAAEAPLVAAQSDGDRVMVVPERAPAPAAPAAAVVQPAARPAPVARFSPPHLQRLRPIVNPAEEAHTAAFMAAPATAASPAVEGDVQALPSQATVASRAGEALPAAVHYGVVDRASLMGRGAGPVYNFKGSSSGSRGSGQ